MARKNAKGSSKQDSGADDTASSNNGNSASNELEDNAPPASLHGLDLSRYRQPALVEALDRLTSFTYAGTLLLKPALKIMWRSALYQDGEVRMQELMSQLIGNAPINAPPTPAAAEAAVAAASSKEKKPSAAAPRSLQERIFHFFFVGMPMAVLVGLATGIVNFISCIWRDVMTVASTSHLLLSQAKTDLSYYMQHPESRPTKDEAHQRLVAADRAALRADDRQAEARPLRPRLRQRPHQQSGAGPHPQSSRHISSGGAALR